MLRLIVGIAFVAMIPISYFTGIAFARKKNWIHQDYYGYLFVFLLLVIGLLVLRFLYANGL